MNFILPSDFKAAAAAAAALVFPKTQFQLFSKEIGIGNLAITFKNPKHFSENFRIKFYIKLRTLVISGYSSEGIVHLTYTPDDNYEWRNGYGFKINKPSSVGDKFEFLARRFYPLLQEFFIREDFINFPLSHEFETAAASVAVQAFPQYYFNLSYWKYKERELYLHFQGDRNQEIKTLAIKLDPLQQQESILFDVDFRCPTCLTLNTKWDDEQYLLFYHSRGFLSWSTLQLDTINPPSACGEKFETIAIKLYPLLQEFCTE